MGCRHVERLLAKPVVEVVGYRERLYVQRGAPSHPRLILVTWHRTSHPIVVEPNGRVLEPLRESSAPRTLLVLVRCEVRLGREARKPVQGPGLAVDRCVVEAVLEFLRFKSDREPSC